MRRQRIAIASAHVGGAGGVERAVFAIVLALADARFDIYATHVHPGHLAEFPPDTRMRTSRWWREFGSRMPAHRLVNRIIRMVRRFAAPRYDLYIHFNHAPSSLPRTLRSKASLLNPAGSDVKVLATHFDAVMMESPSNESFVPRGTPAVLIPPPFFALSRKLGNIPAGLPNRFLLTVMNPHNHAKGADILRRVAPESLLPIVWCYSEQSVSASKLGDDPLPENVIPVRDASPEQIASLYQSCAGYVSFSRTEGYGWAAADALMFLAPIVTRRTGVFSIPDTPVDGVTFYESEAKLRELLSSWDPERPRFRDMSSLDAEAFRERITEFVNQSGRQG